MLEAFSMCLPGTDTASDQGLHSVTLRDETMLVDSTGFFPQGLDAMTRFEGKGTEPPLIPKNVPFNMH